MSKKQEKGRWQELADAKGIDAKYAQEQDRADKELADATAGPDDNFLIPPDDTEMKNPHGEFQGPSAMKVAPGKVAMDAIEKK
ncbi:MAG TPA: hypothetical protein VN718_02485 [Rhizomicrobium sp.]|nr:hypothetical protein [Rhizomicrobium sp.]